ncbi:hypothetical protein [Microbulbifer pacificus]|uniref:Uncharacterized protein n=1 Tax=Microbulbifer pacificus TaxID=407164 RepID=A0AAU0MXX5_9GAMM|nr:hypothetical protein [Microbulbifer pacificus]WOX04858.1 hypothetical protein R5R33_14070 [Microbulbifer pacificus]
MFANKGVKQDIIIAGKSSGKIVTITPQAEPVYKEIHNLARRGNYWAQITVNALYQLVSGRLHQNNIFIKPGPVHRGGEEEFVMILPGCKVTIEKQSKDVFKIVYFAADAGYAELQKSDGSPGIYNSEFKKGRGWRAKKSKKNGNIKEIRGRLVAVCDSKYSDEQKAVQSVAPHIASSHYSTEVGEAHLRDTGFDLHFTPGGKKIGGLRNFKDALHPLKKQDIHVSAQLLARAMFNARNIKNVSWIAEFGGSAVLTQAMKILADQGLTLSEHNIFLFQPKTSQSEILNVARRLNINIGRNLSRVSPINIAGALGQPSATINRFLHEQNYKVGQAIGDGIQFSALLTTGAGVVAVVAGAAGINIGAIAGSLGVAGATAVPALGVFLQALAKATPYLKKAKALGDAAMTTAEHLAPKLHDKIKSKF